MAMKRCPVCGEKYSDTYRRCPFCEEEEALRSGEPSRHRGGHRITQSSRLNVLSTVLTVAILVMACTLIYLLFGETIAEKLGMNQPVDHPGSSISEPAGTSSSGSTVSEPNIGDGSQSTTEPDPVTPADLENLPETLTLSSQDFTMKVGDAPVKLTVSGGSGSYSWSSEDDGVASVDENGNVVAISAGTITVTATDGSGKGTCIVRVKGTGTPNTTGTSTGGTETPTLNKTDVSIKVGESFSLVVSGASGSVAYASDNSGVAAVTESGKVTGQSAGTTTVRATVNGTTLSCIVRVS